MANYQEARIKLTNALLNKLKSAAAKKTEAMLRINNKNFQDEELPLDLFLTTRQTAKIRDTIAKNMSTDIKLSKVQLSNEDMDDVIKIVKSLKDLNVLTDGNTETVKHETKSNKVDFFLFCLHPWLLH